MLEREEYVEQAFFFRILCDRMRQNMATQEVLSAIRDEVLATTKLPMAIDFLQSDLRHRGEFATAMGQLAHYFTSFQTFVIASAESDKGRFDMPTALIILEREAQYRAGSPPPQGVFFYQFECLCRNRLSYDKGMEAMAGDPIYDANWKDWILTVRRQVGLIDIADLIFVRSQHYAQLQVRRGLDKPDKPILFGEKEGRIALANRGKEPLLLFASLNRQLGYPAVPRLEPIDQTPQMIPSLLRRMERLEFRLKMAEEENKGGIDLTKFYVRPDQGSAPDLP